MNANGPRFGPAQRITALTAAVVVALLLIVWSRAADAFTPTRTAATPSASTPATASPAPSTASPATSSSGPYHVVGLGDSVPAGTACDCTSYISLVGQQQAALHGTSAAVTNLAQPGLTTGGLLAQLQQAAVRRAIAAADLVIITIGANDFDEGSVTDDSCTAPALACYQPVLQQQAAQLTTVLKQVSALQDATPATVLVTGYWNVFLDGHVAADRGATYVQNSNALTITDNNQISSETQAQADTYVDIYTPFKGDGGSDDTALLAADGDHPNAAGHRAIAAALEAALVTT